MTNHALTPRLGTRSNPGSDRHRPVQFGDFARAVEPVGEVSIQLVEEGAAAARKQVAAAGALRLSSTLSKNARHQRLTRL